MRHQCRRAPGARRMGDADPALEVRARQVRPGGRRFQVVLLEEVCPVDQADTNRARRKHDGLARIVLRHAPVKQISDVRRLGNIDGVAHALRARLQPDRHVPLRDGHTRRIDLRADALDDHGRAERLGNEARAMLFLELRCDVGHCVFAVPRRDAHENLHLIAAFLGLGRRRCHPHGRQCHQTGRESHNDLG